MGGLSLFRSLLLDRLVRFDDGRRFALVRVGGRSEVSFGFHHGLGARLSKRGGEAACLVPPQHCQFFQGFHRVDAYPRVPSGGGKNPSIGTDAKPLLAGMFRLGDFDRLQLGAPYPLRPGERMLGDHGIR